MNIDKKELGAKLARVALDEIPTPEANAKEITGLVKSGEIPGVGIAHRNNTEYLKSLPDESENNNLGNLPSVSE